MSDFLDFIDPTTDPGTNFYQYANGGWIKKNPLPPEFSRYGTFDKLAEQNQVLIRTLIEDLSAEENGEGSIEKKIGDFFTAGMNEAMAESLGMEPIRKDLERIEKIKDINSLCNCLVEFHTENNQLLFHYFGAPDKANSSMIIANLYQGGLGLPDVDYYLLQDEKSEEIRSRYREYIVSLFNHAGFHETASPEIAEIIFGMEENLARSSMTRLERRDPEKTYHKKAIGEVISEFSEFPWNEYLTQMGTPEVREINLAQPDFFREISRMFRETDLNHWKYYLQWQVINSSAPYLNSALVNAHFDFYGKYLSGKSSLQPRWKRVINLADIALGEAIGQKYVERHFPSSAKARMLEMVENLREALALRMGESTWMSEATRELAKDKLARMRVKIGYPEKWRDYTGLEISAEHFFANIKSASRFNLEYRMNKIGKPVDPDEWAMTPQTVNAYYSPSRNEVVFPAGILQPPFFYPEGDDAINYGSIGMVIGHEMTHGFDDQGRKYDKEGNLKDWWTDEDSARFEEKAAILVEQFNKVEIVDGVHANGKLTLGENIADLGGLYVALTALKIAWEKNSPEEKTGGYTPIQRFFLSYAHVWAQNITREELLRRVREDVHSSGSLRVNGPLANMPEFHEAFGIEEGKPMHIMAEERAQLW